MKGYGIIVACAIITIVLLIAFGLYDWNQPKYFPIATPTWPPVTPYSSVVATTQALTRANATNIAAVATVVSVRATEATAHDLKVWATERQATEASLVGGSP